MSNEGSPLGRKPTLRTVANSGDNSMDSHEIDDCPGVNGPVPADAGVKASAGYDTFSQMGDDAGANAHEFRNASGAVVGKVDSLGDQTLNGLTASQIVETDGTKKLISAAKGTAYNKDFGTGSGEVCEGDQHYTKSQVDVLIDATMKAPEAYNPSSGNYPTTYGGEAVQAGDSFRITAAGTMGGITVNTEDLLIALVDTPGQTDANWMIAESNRDQATETVKGVAEIATQAETDAGTDDEKIVTPNKLANYPFPAPTVLSGTSEGEQTTLNTTPTQAYRFSPTLEVAKYIVIFSCEITNFISTEPTYVRIEIDDTTEIYTDNKSPGISDVYRLAGASSFIYNCTVSGTHNFDIDFWQSSGAGSREAKIRRMRITLMKVVV